MIIDSHQHFWRIGRAGQTWPGPDLDHIHRDFEPAELRRIAEPLGVVGCVTVQSQPCDADTDYLCDLAAGDDFILGVVAWVDLAHPGASTRIAELSGRPKLRGVRPMLQSMQEDDWICRPALDTAIEALIGCGLTFDALIQPRHLPSIAKFAARWPTLPIVINHGAKPPIMQGVSQPWSSDLARAAEQPNVFCKLSGLLTEAGPDAGDNELDHLVDRLFELFGARRLLWGSDWPVVNLAGDYGRWLAYCQRRVPGACEAGTVFAESTRRFYSL